MDNSNSKKNTLVKYNLFSILLIIAMIVSSYLTFSNTVYMDKIYFEKIESSKYDYMPVTYFEGCLQDITIIFVAIYIFCKVLFDIFFNRIKNSNEDISKRKLYLHYILLNISLLIIWFISRFIIARGFLSNKPYYIYYNIIIVGILPTWNILYNIIRYIVVKIKNRKNKEINEDVI